MKDRIQWAWLCLILYTAMWLICIFPLQIILSGIYRIDYQYPHLDKIIALSVQYWRAIIVLRILLYLGGLGIPLVKTIWIDIRQQPEPAGLNLVADVKGPKNFLGRLLRCTAIAFITYVMWEGVNILVIYNETTFLVTTLWAGFVTAGMYFLEGRRS